MNTSSKQWDIIPDIHGHAFKLTSMLSKLGYANTNGAWRYPDPNRTAIFLGDFIDRGPENGKVIDIVRRMIDAGSAQAIMGNHELNAIHFHTLHPDTGNPLRDRTDTKNIDQHETFLKEFQIGSSSTDDAITWMKSLPIYLDFGEFRVVHASWSNAAKLVLDNYTATGHLSHENFIHAANTSHDLFDPIELLTKGPELELKNGHYFHDKSRHRRTSVRVKWWQDQADNWRDIAMSVPDVNELPDCPLPVEANIEPYNQKEKLVFFGHYWLTGTLELQSPNALCLDYSVGEGGPLTSYSYCSGDDELNLGRITQS